MRMTKKTVGHNQQKTTLLMQHTFLYISLLLFCMTTTRNFQVTCFIKEEILYVFFHVCIFHCRSFSPWWLLAFLIFSLPL